MTPQTMTNNDPNVYVACDYFATGEGRTIMILITRAPARSDNGYTDYVGEPRFDENLVFVPGVEQTTKEERALREFKEEFGGYFSIGAEIYSRDEFFGKFSDHVPSYIKDVTDPDKLEKLPFCFYFKTEIHYNYS